METGNTDFIYKNDLDKACFQHDMAYGKYKDLNKRTQSDKILRDKAFEIASNQKYDGYQRRLASMVYNFFDKKSAGSGVGFVLNRQLKNKIHQPILRKFKRGRICSPSKDNIWGVNLADMQLISKYNQRISYLLCSIDLFSKQAWVASLKDKKCIIIVNAYQSILDSSNRKPNKIQIDQGSEFYDSYFKIWLKDNCIEMYSTYNEGKYSKRFSRT